jgi:hypothetical protein
MRLNTIVLTAAISIASTIPAFAHHGWGGNVDEVTGIHPGKRIQKTPRHDRGASSSSRSISRPCAT